MPDSAAPTPPDVPRRTLVTSALPYANGPIHLGHLVGAYLPADLYVRFLRLRGEDVVYVCGSDEMGVAILMRAHAEGRTPQDVIDTFHPVIEHGLRAAGISFDHYGRTSSPVHRETAAAFFEVMADKGVFSTRTETQLFDPVAGVFLADRFVKGTCPVCGNPDAYGDQCERCGSTLSPAELLDPRSALSDARPEPRETTHWYLPLERTQDDLKKWLHGEAFAGRAGDGIDRLGSDGRPAAWKPNVTGQIGSWLTAGLRDRAITRDITWGVPVPPRIAQSAGVEASGKVLYVWFDAPIGYISATKEWAALHGRDWRDYWQADTAGHVPRLVHFIGKDNIVFHGLTFPAMLMLHGQGPDDRAPYVLPEQLPANEFLNLEGQKFSTSRGWAVWLDAFLERFDADAVRYGLATMLPETKDADFSLREFQTRVNGDLADIVGNFVNRALTFAHRSFDGAVPPPTGPLGDDAAALFGEIEAAVARVAAHYEAFRFRDAVFETVALARLGNEFFQRSEPWKQMKTDPQAAAATIYTALQLSASLSVLLEPVVPAMAARLRAMLNLRLLRPSAAPGARADAAATAADLLAEHAGEPGAVCAGWDDAARPLLPPGHRLGTPSVLFAKIPDDVIQSELDRLHASTTPAPDAPAEVESSDAPAAIPYAPLGAEIVYDDFARLDLRVALVTACEPVPKADKLLRLELDMGLETRQVLSGIAAHFRPEEVVGRKVIVVANLAPRTMRGFVSQGMILMAEDRDGRLTFADCPDAEPGSTVK